MAKRPLFTVRSPIPNSNTTSRAEDASALSNVLTAEINNEQIKKK